MKKRLIAIHLPQFHPFKENNEWWGNGFTEWTNVAKARPRYRGHYQPHIPADLGYYDLRLEETRIAQAEMARHYGIYGFCYYHYWFNGKQLMERPVNEIIKSGKPDFPFMLCWANENWSRNWDGGFSKMLIEQHYSINDYENHMRYLCLNVFCDKRYIRVEGKPFFVVYKPQLFPNVSEAIDVWRKTAKEYGIDLYLGYMTRIDQNYINDGFDCAIDFHPHDYGFLQPSYAKQLKDFCNSNILHRAFLKFSKSTWNPFNVSYYYKDYVDFFCAKEFPSLKMYQGITPSWDNSPRRKGWFMELKDSRPEYYGKWLAHLLNKFEPYSNEENFIFVNAWNEWAEGNHLEPDQRWGRAYLEETLKQIKAYNK